MRVEMTMSASGPVPRSHSPVDWIRLSRLIRGFLLSDQVTQLHGPLVLFALDSLPQELAEFEQPPLPRGGARAARHLTDVTGRPVDAEEDRFQASAEGLVIRRAAQPPVG